MRLSIVVLLVTAQTAHAEAIDVGRPPEVPMPAISLGSLGDPQVRVTTLRAAVADGGVTLAITIASRGKGHREVTLPIDVPAGTRVRSLAVTIGRQTVTAKALDTEAARRAYLHEITPYDPRDPALLEQVAPDRLRLRVFPVAPDAPATVAIVFDVAVAAVAIDPGPNRVARPNALELPVRTAWDPVTRATTVDATTSLFAGPPPSPVPTVWLSGPPLPHCSIDKGAIRKVVKVHMDQLTECFQHELQFGHPDLAGRALLQFEIGTDGRVASVRVADDIGDPAVTSCLESQVAGWEFSRSDDRVRVNYPLTFLGAK